MSLLATGTIRTTRYPDFSGTYKISESATVSEESVLGRYEVVLFSRRDLVRVARTASAADGSYSFSELSPSESYVLVAFDHGVSPTSPAISDTPVLTAMTYSF